jgi:cadmium resistance protein CadD (predicted permease)
VKFHKNLEGMTVGEALLASVAAFAATNLDDLLVLMLLFGQAEDRLSRGKICLGQLLGIGVLTLASVAAALGLRMVPEQYVRLLGAVPILLGVRAWLDRDGEEERSSAVGVLSTALLTVANGGDNLGVYIPLLTGFSARQLALCAAVFAVMTLLWCLLGSRLAALPRVGGFIGRYKGILVPAVFILLGVSILL